MPFAGKLDPQSVGINSIWVIVAGVLVMFMQAGFAFLEIGFSRGEERRHRGREDPHQLLDRGDRLVGESASCSRSGGRWAASSATTAVLLRTSALPRRPRTASRVPPELPGHVPVRRDDRVEVLLPVRLLRRVAGDRLGNDARADQVRRLHHLRDHLRGVIYPIGAHWVFGGGFLQNGDWLGTGIVGMQDFAGSTAVHLIGATGAFAALLLLGPRRASTGLTASRGRSPGTRCRSSGSAC